MPILPNRFLGEAPYADTKLVATSVPVGTGATSVADTATTSVLLPKPACTTCQLLSVQYDALVAAVSASGTVLASVIRRNNSGTPADVTLTGTFSLESDGVTSTDWAFPIAITATSVQNVTFNSTDACRVDVVTTNSVGTQPTGTFTGLWAIVKP